MNAAVSTLPKVHDFCAHVSEPLWRLVAAACVKGTPAATRAAILEARAQVGEQREKKLWPRGLVETCMDIALWHAVCELAETGHTITVTTLCSSLASSRKGFSPEQIAETAQRLRVLTQTIDEPVTDIEGLVDQIVKADVRSAQRSAVLAQPLAANPHEVARTIAVLADEVGADQVDDWAEAVDEKKRLKK